jgi:anthranilate synthase component 1
LKDPLEIPDAVLMLCDTIVIFDHLFSVVKVCSNVIYGDSASIDEISDAYKKAVDEILEIELVLSNMDINYPIQEPLDEDFEAVSNVGEAGYKEFVRKVKENILTGDVIQTVPSQRLKKKTNLHAFNAYRKLRTVNPSPYMFYVDLQSFQLVGASPEMLVKVENKIVEMHPIAGTRKRGNTPQKDQQLANELIMDLKERSEHVMLVDLGRNDVNRVCVPSTVKVDSLMHIERYAHVMHIVSHVSGVLRDDQTPFDAFRSIFPAGTVSGAPKIRAMQIIYELEKEKRGVYAGAIGYFGYSGGLDTCIAIRTMLFKDGHVYLQAGGGIVFDSDPDDEYLETVNKLRSNVVAIQEAESMFRNTPPTSLPKY